MPGTSPLKGNGKYQKRPALQWMRTYILIPPQPTLISPISGEDIPRNPVLTWSHLDSADSYHVQVSSNRTFTNISIDTIVTDTLFHIDSLNANTRFYWRASAMNEHGESEFSANATFLTGDQILDVTEPSIHPNEFALFQNYPNPFNPITFIEFQIRTCLPAGRLRI